MVDDNAALRAMAARQLRRLGYRVVEAASGAEAEALVAELDRLDLILTDVVMPGGFSGVELAGRVRVLRPGTPGRGTQGLFARPRFLGQTMNTDHATDRSRAPGSFSAR